MSILSSLAGAVLKSSLGRLGRGRLPQVDGRIYLEGLSRPVTVKRDRWGIPTIHAQNRADLFLAQGFIHAQDRLWQMEIHRRAAAGQLAAMVGEMGLDTDRLSRTLGFARLAQATWDITSEKVRADVTAYAAGINAFLNGGRPLPLEFSLLRHRPGPWTPLDSIAFGRMMAWILSHGFASKLVRAQLVEKVGSKAAAELDLFRPLDDPLTLPHGIEFNILRPDGILRAAQGPFMGRNLEGVGRGSNAWVISGERTTSGRPILCNDMHLPITAPSLWHVQTLQCPDTSGLSGLHVSGASLPGLPYVLIGHNDHIAWGATVSFVDNEDLFVERFAPGNPEQYEFAAGWRPAQIISERIQVRNRPALTEKVVITHHGPLISPVLHTNGQALALASKALTPSRSFDGFVLLNEARNWDDFAGAVHQIESPALNLVYADRAGNIGYYATGRVPIRQTGTGQIPVPGWTGEHEWIGDVPVDEMPHALNPAAGYLITSNNKIVAGDYPYFLGNAWRNGYRAQRIGDLIQGQKELSLQDNCRFQADLLALSGQELLARLNDVDPNDEDAARCLELLREWNGRMDPQSAGALVHKTFLSELSLAILRPRLGKSLTDSYLGEGPHPMLYPFGETQSQWITVLLRLLDKDDSFWLPASGDKAGLLEKCLAKTMVEMRRRLGDDPEQWRWGQNHQILFGHVLAAQRPLDQMFNVGPFSVGGDANTVCQMSVDPENGANNIAPSYRQVIDLVDWETALAMHAPGQSGHLASPHYADLADPWLQGDYYRLNWSQTAVEQATRHTLRLFPPLARPGTPGLPAK